MWSLDQKLSILTVSPMLNYVWFIPSGRFILSTEFTTWDIVSKVDDTRNDSGKGKNIIWLFPSYFGCDLDVLPALGDGNLSSSENTEIHKSAVFVCVRTTIVPLRSSRIISISSSRRRTNWPCWTQLWNLVTVTPSQRWVQITPSS